MRNAAIKDHSAIILSFETEPATANVTDKLIEWKKD